MTQPEMSSQQVGDRLAQVIRSKQHDMVIYSFANPDMVGHTGDLYAPLQPVKRWTCNCPKLLKPVKPPVAPCW